MATARKEKENSRRLHSLRPRQDGKAEPEDLENKFRRLELELVQ